MSEDLDLQQLVRQLSTSAVQAIIEHLKTVRPSETPQALAILAADVVEATGLAPLVWHPLSPYTPRSGA